MYLEEKWFAQKTFVVFAFQDSIEDLLWLLFVVSHWDF